MTTADERVERVWLYGEKIRKWRKVCCTEVTCKLVKEFLYCMRLRNF